jgi:hypothetical protein
MDRLATVRWRSSPPTSVDEELAAYDDGSVWLVIRSSRDGSATIGTWRAVPAAEEHAGLVGVGDVVVELLRAGEVPEVAERLRSAALAAPMATARFLAAAGADGAVTLAVIGDGTRAVEFELDPNTITVHVLDDDAERAWFEVAPPMTGFVTPDAVGLGGLGDRAVVPPGGLGAITLDAPGMGSSVTGEVAVRLAGWLAEGLPDDALPRPFRVRTPPAARG